ncbi:MAG: threonylcarbamoyl-AMP synthase [Bifidobacteriaceae bacterium]|nr:threonylcarbamoyl-AMP synthase [Bifidobacteriaceae bacterium]
MNLRDCRAGTERGEAIARAARLVAEGTLVVLPTDTVYGIAAGAHLPAAVRSLLAAKGRSDAKPPPVLVADVEQATGLIEGLSPAASALVATWWPGPLTLVARAATGTAWDFDIEGTVAIRVPDHDVARALLRESGPLAVSSANLAGEAPALTAREAAAAFGDAVALYLDAGRVSGGLPSTVVDITGRTPRILRVGAIGADRIAAAVDQAYQASRP